MTSLPVFVRSAPDALPLPHSTPASASRRVEARHPGAGARVGWPCLAALAEILYQGPEAVRPDARAVTGPPPAGSAVLPHRGAFSKRTSTPGRGEDPPVGREDPPVGRKDPSVVVEGPLGGAEGPPGKVEARPGKVEDRPGRAETRSGKAETRSGKVEDRPGKVEAQPGQIEAGSVQTDLFLARKELE